MHDAVARRARRLRSGGAWALMVVLMLLFAQRVVQAESRARLPPPAKPAAVPLTFMPLAQARESAAAKLQFSTCPADDAAWLAWQALAVQDLLALRKPPKGNLEAGHREPYLDSEQVMAKATRVADFIDVCQHHRAPPAELDNLRRFTAVQRNANYQGKPSPYSHQFGHGVPDRVLLQRIGRAVALPCLLQSKAFLAAIGKPDLTEARRLIDRQNRGETVDACPADGQQWQVLVYRSQYLGTPDDADVLGRFLVIVPGASLDVQDRWIQFGIATPGERLPPGVRPENASVVAVARRAAGPEVFDALVDWYHCGDRCDGDARVRYRYDATGVSGNCQECHKMMPLSIHPAAVFDDRLQPLPEPAAAAAVAAVNDLIERLYRRPPRFLTGAGDELADPRHYGPPLGALPKELGIEGAERNAATVAACAPTLPLQSREIVADAMNCGECHSNARPGQIGALNYPVATERRRSAKLAVEGEGAAKTLDLAPNLVQQTILQGHMPPARKLDRPLTVPEREALYQCLASEYFQPARPKSALHPRGQPARGLLVDWLMYRNGQPLPTLLAATRPAGTAATRMSAHGLFSSAVAAPAAPMASGDPSRCLKCHNAGPGPHPDGPSLLGVVGRRAAATDYADYSAELRELGAAGLVWDEASLMEFLASPDQFVRTRSGRPDASSNMLKSYPDAALRQQMVEYLKTLK